MRGWNRYKEAERVIYALRFAGARCYVGQTENLPARLRVHKSKWSEPFEVVELDRIRGCYGDAGFLEWAWRWAARLGGWQVFAAPGELIPDEQQAAYTWDEVKTFVAEQGLTWPSSISP